MVDETTVHVAAVAVETAAGLAGTIDPALAPAAVAVVAAGAAVANDPHDVASAIGDAMQVVHPVTETRLAALEALGEDIVKFLVHTFPNHFKPTVA